MRWGLLCSLAVFLLAGCERSGHVAGSVLGHTLEVRDALFARQTVDGKETLVVALFDKEAVCEKFSSGSLVAELGSLALYAAPAPGSYQLEPAKGIRDLQAMYTRSDFECRPLKLRAPDGTAGKPAQVARTGRLTVDEVDFNLDGRAKGSFELVIGPQADVVAGEFSARYCPAITRSIPKPAPCSP